MRRTLLVLTLGALEVLLGTPSASAHALLGTADPARGAQVDEAPERVSIRFTEEPALSLSSIEVFDLDGRAVHTGVLEQDAADPLILRRAVRSLEQGVYTVSWRVLSVVDGHLTAGAYAFGIGVDPSEADLGDLPTGDEAPPLSPLEVLGRALLSIGLALLVGAAWTGAVAFDEVSAGVRRLAAMSSLVSIAGLVVFAEAQRRASGASIGALLATPIGTALIGRAAGVGVATLSSAIAVTRARLARPALALAGAAAAFAIFAHVSSGHAGTGEGLWVKVTGQWVHVVAAGVWLGGLAAVLAGAREPGERAARAVRRFSRVAGVTLVVVLVTGVARSINELNAIADLWSSRYGAAIVIKVAGIAALGVLGFVNRSRNVPAAASSLTGLRRVSRAELGVAGIVVLAAAVLASTSPPPEVSATEAIASSPIEATATDRAGTTRVALTVSPGFAGPNAFTARITQARGGAPVEAERVALLLSYLDDPSLGESQVELARGEDGLWRASAAAMALPGRWRLTVLVQGASDSTEVPFTVATKCRVSETPVEGGPTLYDAPAGDGTAQGYVDPGVEGFNEVHITFFDAGGIERAIDAEPEMFATPPDGERIPMVVRRFSKGHFLGDAQLRPGVWRFDIVAPGPGGEALRICFNDEIGR